MSELKRKEREIGCLMTELNREFLQTRGIEITKTPFLNEGRCLQAISVFKAFDITVSYATCRSFYEI
jgi:hypothetical protein